MSESGKTIGRFEVTTELGRGSMGIVSRAHDPVMGRDVAIKTFLLPNGLDDHDRKRYMERFLREARAAGRLSHPGIVTIYDFHEGPDDSAPFIAMEYIEGPTLHETIVREGAQDPEWVLAMGESLADALHLAHREGVVHRDLKPANILIRKSDRVAKIADFGIARINAADQTEAGVTVGSPAYMSPERLRGERADARSDLFSLGVILYEAVTGRSPFDAEVFEVTCYSILNEPPPPSLDANWDRFFERALAKDRMARFQTGAEFRDAVIALRDQQLSRTLDRLETSLDASASALPAPAPTATATATATVRMNISDILAAEARVVASLDLEIPVAKPPIEPVIGFPTGRTTNPLHIGIGAIVLVGFAIFAAMLVGREVDRAGWTSDTREVPAGSAPSSEISEVLIPSGIAIDQATPKNSAAETETKEPPSAKSAPLPQPAAPVREEKLRTIPEPSPPIRDVQPPAVEAWSPRTSSSSAVEMERERINAGDVAVSLSLQIKSFVETGTLTLYIDGDSVFATDLRREAAGRLHRLKKVVHRGEQSIDQTLDVASGVHEFRVVMYNEAKDRTLDRTITAELEPGVGRTLQITAGRTFGKRLSLSLH